MENNLIQLIPVSEFIEELVIYTAARRFEITVRPAYRMDPEQGVTDDMKQKVVDILDNVIADPTFISDSYDGETYSYWFTMVRDMISAD